MKGLVEFIEAWFQYSGKRHYRHRARWLHFNFRFGTINVTGAFMTVTMLPTDTKRTTVSPVKADGTPSTAKLSNQSYVSSDTALLQVAQDPADPTGNTIILTGQGNSGTAILTATATATEPDGTTTETVTGALTVVLAVPPPAPAAALVFSPLV